MPYVVTQEMLESLTEADQTALVSIYRHRCLDERLLYKYIYSRESAKQSYAKEHIEFLLSQGYISAVDYGNDAPALFLEALGISAVRRILVYPEQRSHSAASLKMKTFLINHQMHLNKVALDIEREAIRKHIPCEYYDCKYMEFNGEVMPDGMFRFNEYDIYLEMDMGTEAGVDLIYKWGNYRSFLNSEQFHYQERKTVVLFLLCGVKKPEIRRATVLTTLSKGLFDKMAPRFDIYIGTPQQMQRLLFNELLSIPNYIGDVHAALRQLGFLTTLATPFNEFLIDAEYSFYTRMLSNKTHRVLSKNGRVQEFLLDIAPTTLPTSVLAKAVCHNSTTLPISARLSRNIPYLIIGEDERAILADVKAAGVMGTPNLFFSTLERLQKAATIADAVFQIDQLGRIYHFADSALTDPIFE